MIYIDMINQFRKYNKYGPFLLYFLLGIILFPYYRFRINPDAISYFDIARNYLHGFDGVNHFWSPMLSWLLVPFFKLNINPEISFGIIQLVAGFLTLVGVQKVLQKLSIAKDRQYLAHLFSVPLVLYFVYEPAITPDLLVLSAMVFYLNSLLGREVNGYVSGLLGALAYFAKTYAFFFFIVHYCFVVLSKRETKALLKGLVAFAIISGVWIGAMSFRYHRFTTGNAGTYNFAVNRPGGLDHPNFYNGLVKPQPNATSAWIDPSSLEVIYNRPSLVSQLVGWVKVIAKNCLTLVINYEGFSIFAVVILAYSIIRVRKQDFLILFSAFALYSLGYSIYHIEDRFIWFGVMLLFFMAAKIETRKLFYILLLLSFVPLASKRLVANLNYRKDVYVLSTSVKVSGNIASNGNWNNSLYVAYYNSAVFYGVTKGSEAEVLKSIKDNKIDYLLVWGDLPKYAFLNEFPRAGNAENLTVYKLD